MHTTLCSSLHFKAERDQLFQVKGSIPLFQMKLILRFLVFSCFLFRNAWTQGSRITCPKPFYEEGESDLHLTVDNSTFSLCDAGPTTATCLWSSETGKDTIICTLSVTSCSPSQNSLACRCDDTDGKIYNYTLAFSKLAGQNKGSISCSLDCSTFTPGAPIATIQTDQTCQNITFETKCTEYKKMCKRGYCRIDDDYNPICDCTDTDHEGKYCDDPKPTVVGPSACFGIISVIGIFLIGVFFLWMLKHRSVKADGPINEDEKNDLRKKVQGKACCSCSSVSVDFLHDVTDNRTVVILKSRNFCNLQKAYKQTQALAKKTTTSDPNNKPRVDNPRR